MRMKKLIFGMLTIGVLFTSCGKDEPECTADDYAGVYVGTVSCPGESPDSGSVTLTKISDRQISLNDNLGFVILLDVNECEAKGTLTEDNEIFTVTLNFSGDGFSWVGVQTEGGVSTTCTGSFSK